MLHRKWSWLCLMVFISAGSVLGHPACVFAGDDDVAQCRKVVAEAVGVLLSGSQEESRRIFELPSGGALSEFDAMLAMSAAAQRLQAALDKVNPPELTRKVKEAMEEQMKGMREAVMRGEVVVAGDSATLTYTTQNPSSASGKSTMTRKLVRRGGVWRVDAGNMLGLKGSGEVVQFLKDRTAVIEEVRTDVEAGREKAPIGGEELIQKKMFMRAFEKGLEAKGETPGAKAPPPKPRRAERPVVDPAPAPGEIRRIAVDGRVRCIAFPTSRLLATGATHAGESVVLWDWKTGKKVRSFQEPGIEFHVLALEATRDGTRVIAAGEGFDAAELAEARKASPDASPYQEAGVAEADVRLWDRASGRLIRRMTGDGESVLAMDLSNDERYLAFGTAGGSVFVYELATGKQVKRWKPTKLELMVPGVRFSPDGKSLAVGNLQEDKDSVIVYSVADWTRQTALSLDRSAGRIAFAPDGTLAASRPGLVALFGAEPKPLGVLFCSNGAMRPASVGSIAFSRDGRIALTAEGIEYDKRELTALLYDTTAQVRVFDVKSREQIALLRGHADAVWQAVFAPDGRSIVTASADGTVREWRLPSEMKAGPAKP